MTFRTIGVIGAGAWGVALANVAARAGHDVALWARDPDHVADMRARRESRRLPGVALEARVRPEADLSIAGAADLVLMVTPAQALDEAAARLAPHLRALPDVHAEIDRFVALVAAPPPGWQQRTTHFLSLGWKRWQVHRRVRRALAATASPAGGHADSTRAGLQALLRTIDAVLRAAQQAAQFSTYERLFSLWHVVHLPFLCMLVITAIIHVVAVHVY